METTPMPDDREMSTYLEVAGTCACGNLRRASRIITQVYDRFLQPSGLKATQLILLMAVGIMGPVPVTKLAKGVQMDRTTCTRNLAALRKRDLVAYTPGNDRRTKQVVLSNKGREKLVDAYPLWEKAQQYVTAEVGKERVADLVREVSNVAAILRKS